MQITGFGKDTFNSILANLIRDYHIYGDSYAEVIRDEKGKLINIKVLDPAKIKIVASNKGLIKKYVLFNKGKETSFEPDDILHLSRLRVSDEIHGVSIIEAVEELILCRNEAIKDYRKLLHRNIYPVRLWKVDSSNATKLAQVREQAAKARYDGEDLFVPKGTVEQELISVPHNATLNPIPWISWITQEFYKAVGVPMIIVGGSQELTQTAAQVAYLAFEQTIEMEQLFVEDQILTQLNLEIELSFPASLQSNMLNDNRKDSTVANQMNQASNLQPPMMRGAF